MAFPEMACTHSPPSKDALRSNFESPGFQLMVLLFSHLGLRTIGVTDRLCCVFVDYGDFSEQCRL
jgi:hypothetical protein